MRAPWRARRSREADRGFSIVEVTVAIGLFALVSAGLVTSLRGGLNLIGSSSGVQTGTQLAARWLEEARGFPYDALGLAWDTTFAGAGTPDEAVAQGSGGYTYDAGAGPEPLVVNAEGQGGLLHHEEVDLNGHRLGLYRYVTWVAAGGEPHAYKRVTVVVQRTDPASGATARTRLSTIVGANAIAWADAGPTTTAAPTSTTTAPTTTTTAPGGSCEGDVSGPSGTASILAGTGAQQGYTSSSVVTISISVSDPCDPVDMRFSNDQATWSAWEPLASVKVWTLAAGNGERTVWMQFRDGNGNVSARNAAIRVDATPPSTPGSFAVRANHGQETAKLTWTPSTDNDTLIGYRIYKKIGSTGSFQNVPPGVVAGAPTEWTDTAVQRNLTYTYYVVAYDAAGNESARTPQITVTI
jgi:hypothetical protein